MLRAYIASKCKKEAVTNLEYTRENYIRYAYAFTQLTLRAFRGKSLNLPKASCDSIKSRFLSSHTCSNVIKNLRI